MKKKILVSLLSFALIVTMMPLSVFAQSNTDNEGFVPASSLEKGDQILLPVDNTAGVVHESEVTDGHVAFKVLDTQTSVGGKGVFVISNDLLNYGASGTDKQYVYEGSAGQAWCRALLAEFPESLQDEILETTKEDPAYSALNYTAEAQTMTEKVFALSPAELTDTKYFENDAARVATIEGQPSRYWSRTVGHYQSATANFGATVTVRDNGTANLTLRNDASTAPVPSYRPGLNLNDETMFEKLDEGLYRYVQPHEVSFDTNGGYPETIESQMVVHGEYATPPTEEVVKEGFEFDCWTLNGVEFEFATTPITEDITLKAKWTPTSSIPVSSLDVGDVVYMPIDNSGKVVDEGQVEDGQIGFRIVGEKTNTDTDDGKFCISDKVLTESKAFGSQKVYEGSDAQAWCKSLLAAMSTELQGDLLKTTKSEEAFTLTTGTGQVGSYAALTINDEQIFLPSGIELFQNSEYFPSDASRIAEGATNSYWSRSGGTVPSSAGTMDVCARADNNGAYKALIPTSGTMAGFRPCLNISDEAMVYPLDEEAGLYAWTPATPPGPVVVPAITGFSAHATGTSEVKLSWDQSSDPRVQYYVYKGLKPSGDWGDAVDTVPNYQTVWCDDEVEVGQTYYYMIRGGITTSEGTIFGPYTKIDYGKPAVPKVSNFHTYAPTYDSALIKWDKSADPNAEYFLYKGFKPTGNWGNCYEHFEAGYSPTEYVDKKAETGVKAYYMMRIGVDNGDGTYSFGPYTKVDYAYPRVSEVKGFHAWASDAVTANLAWEAPKDENIVYFIYKGYTPTGDWGKYVDIVGHDTTKWQDPKAKTGVKAYYMVRPAVQLEDGSYIFGPYTKVDYAYPR